MLKYILQKEKRNKTTLVPPTFVVLFFVYADCAVFVAFVFFPLAGGCVSAALVWFYCAKKFAKRKNEQK